MNRVAIRAMCALWVGAIMAQPGYRWTLDQRVDGALERVMEGNYERGGS